ncbi:hypothetical protein Pla175_42770 [Pirellulimonas nuda]|uniref:Zinc-finger domain-containing protein n=1 Tax=Pirellulimonas nuda TaxID=2528009 RepID=A0A518DHB8_9BACT|nr:hypothetical protein [Pirellulimonas nuda]QDU90864.1 hypothetical protein Pla175_42770 [Pirellulimonas nuda]
MDCDRVFFALTRGPFPTGHPTDTLVQAHLEACPSCSQIAEALRPATETFHEAISPAEGRDLPGYWHAGPTHSQAYRRVAAAAIAAPPVRRLQPHRRPSPLSPAQQRKAYRLVWQLLSASAVLAVVGLFLAWAAHF